MPPHQSSLAPALQHCAAKAEAGSHSPSLPRDFCPVPWDTAGWLRQQLTGQRRKPATGDRTQRTTSLPHGYRGRALVNGSLCWQRLTVPQLLAQALSCQRMPGVPLLSGRDFRARCQQNSSCVWLWAALFHSPHEQPSQPPAPQSPAQAAHLLPLTHSVLQTCSSRGSLVRHSSSPQEASSNIALPNHRLSPRKENFEPGDREGHDP